MSSTSQSHLSIIASPNLLEPFQLTMTSPSCPCFSTTFTPPRAASEDSTHGPPLGAASGRKTPLCSATQSSKAALSRRSALRLAALTVASSIAPPLPSKALQVGLREGEAAKVLARPAWPETWPYVAADFARYDERPDSVFYAAPRLVRHIDNDAVIALKRYYASRLKGKRDVLDICSSLEAYLPVSWPERSVVAGVGMNQEEMANNPALTKSVVRDLNQEPRLPYADGMFDLVMCNLSIDYLTKPKEVVQEMRRVLRVGGNLALSFSNRVFASKAVAVWMSGSDSDHIYAVGSYIHYAGGFSAPTVADISPRNRNGQCTGDPLYVVEARRTS